jgi:hypothetical protein
LFLLPFFVVVQQVDELHPVVRDGFRPSGLQVVEFDCGEQGGPPWLSGYRIGECDTII